MDPFVSDCAYRLVVNGARLFWSTGCGGDLMPPQSRVRYIQTDDAPGTMVTLYMPSTCQGDSVASLGVAVDDVAAYWLTQDGHVVSLPTATPGATPTVLCSTQTTQSIRGDWPSPFGVASDGQNVYWSEGANLFSVPTTGGAANPIATVAGADPVRWPVMWLAIGSDGYLYFTVQRSFMRIRAASGAAVETIGEGCGGFALSGSRIAWIAIQADSPVASVVSAPANSLSTVTTHYTTDGAADARHTAVIDSLAIDDANVYWHELRNITGGPLARRSLANDDPVVIFSDYLQGNTGIVTDGRYVYWTDLNSSIFRVEISAHPVTAPGRVRVTGIEAVQSVQTADSQVPLIANKRTFVRVYCESTEDSRGPWTDVGAFLSVRGQPSGAAQSTLAVLPSPSRRRAVIAVR